MHMADALVSPVVAGTLYACSGIATGYALKKMRTEDINHKIPVMGVLGAFVFATQMINFTIPGTGSSGHLTGGMMLSAILGPEAGFLTMIAIMLIQCLMFADGGILALGCNVWNMGFYGCFVGGYLIWNLFMRNGFTKSKIVWASIIGVNIVIASKTLKDGKPVVSYELDLTVSTALPAGTYKWADSEDAVLTLGRDGSVKVDITPPGGEGFKPGGYFVLFPAAYQGKIKADISSDGKTITLHTDLTIGSGALVGKNDVTMTLVDPADPTGETKYTSAKKIKVNTKTE